ncbi:iron-sulfur cluster assembly scaffold protein [Shewanella sp. KX20019]|uniref:iron-sulfur cluster assembly scaffold protein n=1 Tax=Shewanella sp. KX20019 TaxID=2803864 RepID=UPI0019281794|nr:iron-sulfur cluster assembly scaffold protein [Shewanella sp. KX20019]QQX80330.1 iron-sulfur cluster assembly scaffold protein [Shewanella sp. KX20019]
MYNDIIIDNFSNPEFVGDLASAEHKFEIGNPVCGDRIKIQVNLDGDSIRDSRFRAWGCATSVATANVFCRSIMGRSFAEISARQTAEIAAMLGELEPSQQHCVNILIELHRELSLAVSLEEA